jgi:SAM-dependent methyltransferase
MNDFTSLLRCPRCHADVADNRCVNAACSYSAGFPLASGQPVMIDFDRSVFEPSAFSDGRGSVLKRDDERRGLRARLDSLVFGANPVAPRIATAMVRRLRENGGTRRLLVIGGGERGSGADPLYQADDIELVGTDVYASACTRLVADGHELPFKDSTFDAVWIQAVLEHVLEPCRVVDEIHRVLKPSGLVYADTPFMAQVHEGAYDFTRFTLSGHRWLLRRFEEIEAGPVAGAGTVLSWSAQYLLHAMGAPSAVAWAARYASFPLRYLDQVGPRRNRTDAASSVYFFGLRSEHSIGPKDIVAYYRSHAEPGRRGLDLPLPRRRYQPEKTQGYV